MSLIDDVFALSPAVRYVALYTDGRLVSRQREGLTDASAGESDKYEELIVNPTLLTLTRQRGDIDCGGLRFVVVRYGSFFEIVQPLRGGHLSVGIEPDAPVIDLARRIAALPAVAAAAA